MPEIPTKQCLHRLQKEYRNAQKDPNPLFATAPDPKNILEWYFVFDGPPDTPFEGGRYLGRLRLPPDYPYKPPRIGMCTPNGRFKTDTDICLSNSSFHPEEWNPMWSVSTIVNGLISFLPSTDMTSGAVTATDAEKVKLARGSRAYNVARLAHVYRAVLPAQFEKDKAILETENSSNATGEDVPPSMPVPASVEEGGAAGVEGKEEAEATAKAAELVEAPMAQSQGQRDQTTVAASPWFAGWKSVVLSFIGLMIGVLASMFLYHRG